MCKMPFCHLIQYFKSKSSVDIAGIQKVKTKPTSIKYKFRFQVPNCIKTAVEVDGNSLYQDAIKTELKQLTDYQTCIVLDSGENILTASTCIVLDSGEDILTGYPKNSISYGF